MIKDFLLKKILLINVFLMASLALFAKNAKYDQGHPINEDQMLGAYNASARYDVKGSFDVFTELSFIYWQPKEQGTAIALIKPTIDATQAQARIINADFNFTTGFKALFGTSFTNDNWTTWAKYTFLHSKNFKKIRVNENETLTNFWRTAEDLDDLTTIFAKWLIYLDILDLSFGRPCYVGTKLTFHPFVGLKGGWITQKLYEQYIDDPGGDPTHYKTTFRSNSYIIGPRIGLNTNWLLGDGFKFFGNISTSLFYQRFKLRLNEDQVDDPVLKAKNTEKHINSNLELAVGLGWGCYFFEKRSHFDITLGYEALIFWNQNTLSSFCEELSSLTNAKPGNLTSHGFTITARFDF